MKVKITLEEQENFSKQGSAKEISFTKKTPWQSLL